MRKSCFLVLGLLMAISSMPSEAQTRQQRLTDHVWYLAGDSLKGRRAGSQYARIAAEYIRKQYEEIGVKPFFKDWYYDFSLPSGGPVFRDVVGVIEGSDPELKDEYIILGAHYDHLGTSRTKIYNGADDNASGSAALIEIARELYAERANMKRSVIIAAFDAEELGLLGSKALADTLSTVIDMSRIKLMMSIDMVGWYRASGKLKLQGVATIKYGHRLLAEEAERYSITIDPVNFEKSLFTATDTEAFACKSVPTLAVTTGLKSPYHKPEDDADLIDYEGLDKVSEYVSGLALSAASDSSFSGSGRFAAKHKDKIKPLEVGMVVTLDETSLNFSKSAFTGRLGYGVSTGPQAQVNFGCLAINAKALYEFNTCKFPDDGNLFGSSLKYRQQALTVPVMLVLQSKKSSSRFFSLGIGGYYSRVFQNNASELTVSGNSFEINPDQYGIQYGFSLYMTPFFFSIDARRQLNGFFSGNSQPDAFLRSANLSIGFLF